MGAIGDFFRGLFGGAPRRGHGLEKIYLYAKDREATGSELVNLLNDARTRVIMDALTDGKSSYQAATEEWKSKPGETDLSALERVAYEVSRMQPGKSIYHFAYPDAELNLIVVVATEPNAPFPLEQAEAAFGTKIHKLPI